MRGRLGFSLRALFIVTAAVALASWALVTPTDFCVMTVKAVTRLTLLTCAVIGVYGHGRSRAFCGGVALFGIGYILLSAQLLGFDTQRFESRLLDQLWQVMEGESADPLIVFTDPSQNRYQHFLEISNHVTSLAVAALGGLLAICISSRTPASPQE